MKYCFLFLSAIVLLNACTKVETPKSKQEQLMEGKWRVDTGYITKLDIAGAYITEDVMASRAECLKDDYIIFRENGTAGLLTAGMKCANGQVDEISIKYGITDGDTKMYIYDAAEMLFGSNSVNARLKSFSDTKFVIEYTKFTQWPAPSPVVDTMTYTVTLKKM